MTPTRRPGSCTDRDRNAVFATGELPGVKLNNPQTTMTYMKRTYDSMSEQIIKDAQAAFRGLPADVQAYLDHDSGDGQILTNSPHLRVALALHQNGFTRLTLEQAEKEIKHLRSQSKLDALGLAKLKVARHIASRGKSSDNAKLTQALKDKPAPKVAPSATAGIEKRIKELRTHPAYLDASHKSHKEVVQQVSDLYSQLHGTK